MAEMSLFHSLGWYVGQIVVYAALSLYLVEWVIDKIKDAASA